MLDISKDPDYASAYDKMPQEPSNDPEMHEERRFFMSHADDLSMQMTVLQVNIPKIDTHLQTRTFQILTF